MGGVQPHFCPWKNVCFPIFSHGENGEKSIWKEREMNTFPFLSIYFFSHFSPWGKMGKHTFFHGQKWGWIPPPPELHVLLFVAIVWSICVGEHSAWWYYYTLGILLYLRILYLSLRNGIHIYDFLFQLILPISNNM